MSQSGSHIVQGLPHDIRGLVPYQTPWWHTALVMLAGGVVLGLIAWGLWQLRKKWRAKQPAVPPEDPWDSLERRLNLLSPPGEFTRGPVQEQYFYSLSLLLREAIELRTGIRATDLTLYELRKPLREKLPLRGEDSAAILSFLERADLVKFAGAPSLREEALADQGRVRLWVTELRPRLVSTGPQVASGAIFQDHQPTDGLSSHTKPSVPGFESRKGEGRSRE